MLPNLGLKCAHWCILFSRVHLFSGSPQLKWQTTAICFMISLNCPPVTGSMLVCYKEFERVLFQHYSLDQKMFIFDSKWEMGPRKNTLVGSGSEVHVWAQTNDGAVRVLVP
jgi:hypothetical protein